MAAGTVAKGVAMSTTSTHVGLGVGLLTALTAGLIYLERTAPLAAKPSIRLRSMTGDLPAADLEALLRDEDRRLQAAQADAVQMQRAKAAQVDLGDKYQKALRQLDDRVNERQSAQWSAQPQ